MSSCREQVTTLRIMISQTGLSRIPGPSCAIWRMTSRSETIPSTRCPSALITSAPTPRVSRCEQTWITVQSGGGRFDPVPLVSKDSIHVHWLSSPVGSAANHHQFRCGSNHVRKQPQRGERRDMRQSVAYFRVAGERLVDRPGAGRHPQLPSGRRHPRQVRIAVSEATATAVLARRRSRLGRSSKD